VRNRHVSPSPAVAQALVEFGAGLRDLRRRRRLPMTYAADAALVSRATLHKIERGDPSVSFGIYAKVLGFYGLLGRLTVIVDGRFDAPGLALERARLPRRVHLELNSRAGE
jgi:transcriptional regulator with XRE-family HTH domain